MAWAEKMTSGRYRGRYYDANGDKQTVLDGRRGFERKRDAKKAAADKEVRAQRRASESAKPAGKLLYAKWWARIKDERDDPLTGTFEVEESMMRLYIMPWWGETPLNRITRAEVQRWVNHPRGLKVRPGMSPAYARRIYNTFAATMRMALDADPPVLDATPCARIKLPHVPKRRKPHHTSADVAQIKRADYKAAAEFIYETGLRPGELCGLHAADDYIDRETGWMRVWLVYVEARDIIRPFPKDDDERFVPLTPRALEIIDEQTRGRDLTGGCGVPHAGERCHSALVFLTRDGKPMRPRNLTRHLGRCNVPGMYAGRRGWITRAADGGLSPFDIAAIAGHADVRTTQGYWQMTPEMRERVIAALGQQRGLRVVVGHDDARGAKRGVEPGNAVNHDEASREAESGG